MVAHYNAWSNHCFTRSNKKQQTINLQNDTKKHVQLQSWNKLSSISATTGFVDHFLCNFSLLCLITELCLSTLNLWMNDKTFLLSYFSPSFSDFKISPTAFMFMTVLQSVRGVRWAFGSRGKRQSEINIPTLPLCPEPKKQGSLLIQINYTKTLS